MDFESLGMIVVPAIAVICFLVGEAVKITKINTDWVPIVCGVIGGIPGPVAMYTMPEFPARDVLTAIAVGIFSGLSATGLDQLFKRVGVLVGKKTN